MIGLGMNGAGYWLDRAFMLPILFGLITLLVTGCSKDNNTSNIDADITPSQTGVFVDSPVSGLQYTCSSGVTGITNQEGGYSCNEGDLSVEFSINGYIIGSSPVAEILSPYDLSSNTIVITNIAQLLQTLDDDNFADNGIAIPQSGTQYDALANLTVALDNADFDTIASSILGEVFVDEITAMLHLDDTRAVLFDCVGDGFKIVNGICSPKTCVEDNYAPFGCSECPVDFPASLSQPEIGFGTTLDIFIADRDQDGEVEEFISCRYVNEEYATGVNKIYLSEQYPYPDGIFYEYTIFPPSGEVYLSSTTEIMGGNNNGEYRSYFSDGNLLSTAYYINGEKEGENPIFSLINGNSVVSSLTYYSQGIELLGQLYFLDGLLGTCTLYVENELVGCPYTGFQY